MNEGLLITHIIMVGTIIVTLVGWNNPGFQEQYLFDAQSIRQRKEWHRLITSGFLHADVIHLFFNMFVLYNFGPWLELAPEIWAPGSGTRTLIAVYFSAIVGGGLLSYFMHRHEPYRALGASGGVSGVVYAMILIAPDAKLSLILLPIPIPAAIFGLLYMVLTAFGMKHRWGNIGHDAHFGGAVIGFLVMALMHPILVRANFQIFAVLLAVSVGLFIYVHKTHKKW